MSTAPYTLTDATEEYDALDTEFDQLEVEYEQSRSDFISDLNEIDSRVNSGDLSFSVAIELIERREKDIRRTLNAKVEKMTTVVEEMKDISDYRHQGGFQRPNSGLAGLVSRPLGALPHRARLIHPTAEKLATIRSYRWQGLTLLSLAIASIITLTLLVPALRTSPAILAIKAGHELFGPGWVGTAAGMAMIFILFKLLASGTSMATYRNAKFWDSAAMSEEQWFRMGSESWSPSQRIYSCTAFGFIHIGNIIYPISSLIVVGLVGGVFMWTYLREYKRSGSVERATLASAKLHATYNRFSIIYIIVAITLVSIVAIVS